jgi:hypothetical protein
MRAALVVLAALAAVPPLTAADRTTEAKTLFFDRHYAAAREAWAAAREAGGSEAALYWIARCSERLDEPARALAEYGRYLEAHPSDPVLMEEARTSRVALATRLVKAGDKEHLRVVTEALEDPSRTVRYFAALQLSTLGPALGRRAVPVLRRIVAEESDPDLQERAKLALLRLEPGALAEVTAPPRRDAQSARWIHVRIDDKGESKVSIDLPLALAELVFKSLPEDAKQDLRRRGYEAETFLDHLRRLKPTDLIVVHKEGGERIRIWIE